jgi:glycosyltransferase involved in cell wall biosynthesis
VHSIAKALLNPEELMSRVHGHSTPSGGAVPRVTVVVPYYNSAWSIERTLLSVMAQRYRNFELILVDDGSPGDVTKLVAPFGDAIRVVRQENRGLAGARNRGISESLSTFVAPLDADDLWHPDFLGTMVAALDAAPLAPFAFADSYRIDERDRILRDRELAAAPQLDFAGLISLNTVRSGSGAVFRRDSLLAVGGYDESLHRRSAQGAEDWKLLVQLSAIAPPVHVPRKLIAYRLVERSMSQARPEQQLRAIETVIADLRGAYPSAPAHLFRDGRTMMIAWLLPAFLRKRAYATALRHAMRAYIANPLWWRNRNLRLAHVAWVHAILATSGETTARPPSLAELEDEGDRPFHFLDAARRE